MYPTTQTRRRSQPAPLSQVLDAVMGQGPTGVLKRCEMAKQVSSLWEQLLPPELAKHCRVVELSAGLLTVEVDSPSYKYEMQISSGYLLEYLRRGCPAAKLKAIKVLLTR